MTFSIWNDTTTITIIPMLVIISTVVVVFDVVGDVSPLYGTVTIIPYYVLLYCNIHPCTTTVQYNAKGDIDIVVVVVVVVADDDADSTIIIVVVITIRITIKNHKYSPVYYATTSTVVSSLRHNIHRCTRPMSMLLLLLPMMMLIQQ